MSSYINHYPRGATAGRDRRSFIDHYWRLAARDPRWTPPFRPTLTWALNPMACGHMGRLDQYSVVLEATRVGRRPHGASSISAGMTMPIEAKVGAAAVLGDRRRSDGLAYLALVQCINDPDTWMRLLAHLGEVLPTMGYFRLVGPTALSPYVGGGLLMDHWDLAPPAHSAYSPPYMPELLSTTGRPWLRLQLYDLAIGDGALTPAEGPAKLVSLDEHRLAEDLLPLVQLAAGAIFEAPAPDALEIAFLRRWLRPGPLSGWVAQVGTKPVGFVLMQPDLSEHLRRIAGGRNLFYRLLAPLLLNRPAGAGRVLFGAVLPDWQGRGIGRQLLARVLLSAQQRGWHSVGLGPFPTGSRAAAFLQHAGASARQSYELYEWRL